MNRKENERVVAFHPGYYVGELIEEEGITQTEFAKRLGTTDKTLSKLVNGLIPISNELASKLSLMTGTSVGLWLNLQVEYEKRCMEIERAEQLRQEIKYLDVLDYKYFKERGLVREVREKDEKIKELFRCLKVSSLSILERDDFLVCYRTATSAANNKKIICSNAWVQIAINKANEIETKPFDEKRLNCHIEEIRGMTVQKPDVFLPRLYEILSSCGVALVILPHLRNSGINGATKWLGKDKVMIAINTRGRDADKFWFAMFHEICHLKQKRVKRIMVQGEGNLEDLDETLELECDQYASDVLIPRFEYKRFLTQKDLSAKAVRQFADRIGIHPGIVVGRLQHDERISYENLNNLKIKYDIV